MQSNAGGSVTWHLQDMNGMQKLVRVLPQYTRAGRGLSVVYPCRQQRPLAATAFADMAVKKLSHQDWVPASGA